MAEFLRNHPELQPFVLTNVRLTGTTIGAGAYGSVEEVAVPGAVCAAKKIHDVFLSSALVPSFVRECQLMSTLRHPTNAIQEPGEGLYFSTISRGRIKCATGAPTTTRIQ